MRTDSVISSVLFNAVLSFFKTPGHLAYDSFKTLTLSSVPLWTSPDFLYATLYSSLLSLYPITSTYIPSGSRPVLLQSPDFDTLIADFDLLLSKMQLVASLSSADRLQHYILWASLFNPVGVVFGAPSAGNNNLAYKMLESLRLNNSGSYKSGSSLDSALASYDLLYAPFLLFVRLKLIEYISSIDPLLKPPAGSITINNEVFNEVFKNANGESIADILGGMVFPNLESSFEVY